MRGQACEEPTSPTSSPCAISATESVESPLCTWENRPDNTTKNLSDASPSRTKGLAASQHSTIGQGGPKASSASNDARSDIKVADNSLAATESTDNI